jgi:hypothetical protein
MQLLLDYMYSHDPVTFIKNLHFDQLEKVVKIADQFNVTHLLSEADKILHGAQTASQILT